MVDKIERRGGRGELRLQSMSITFPDGYVTPIAGPIVLETTDGYAIKDPGSKRSSAAIILPLAGVGLGSDRPFCRHFARHSYIEHPSRM